MDFKPLKETEIDKSLKEAKNFQSGFIKNLRKTDDSQVKQFKKTTRASKMSIDEIEVRKRTGSAKYDGQQN